MDLYELLNASMDEAEKEARFFGRPRPRPRPKRTGHFIIEGRKIRAPKGQIPMTTRVKAKALREFSWSNPAVAKNLEKGNIDRIHKDLNKYVAGYAKNRGLSEAKVQQVMAAMSKSPAVSARLVQRARSKVARDPKLQAKIPPHKIGLKGRLRQVAIPGVAVTTAGAAYAGLAKPNETGRGQAPLPTHYPQEWRNYNGY
jgi:hypothetical protein